MHWHIYIKYVYAHINTQVYLIYMDICVYTYIHTDLGFPSGSTVKNLPANAGGASLTPGSGRFPGEGNGWPLESGRFPWRRKWQLTPVFLSGEFHGQRSLVGYSPWGRKRVSCNLAAKQQQQQHPKPGESSCCSRPRPHPYSFSSPSVLSWKFIIIFRMSVSVSLLTFGGFGDKWTWVCLEREDTRTGEFRTLLSQLSLLFYHLSAFGHRVFSIGRLFGFFSYIN